MVGCQGCCCRASLSTVYSPAWARHLTLPLYVPDTIPPPSPRGEKKKLMRTRVWLSGRTLPCLCEDENPVTSTKLEGGMGFNLVYVTKIAQFREFGGKIAASEVIYLKYIILSIVLL